MLREGPKNWGIYVKALQTLYALIVRLTVLKKKKKIHTPWHQNLLIQYFCFF